FLPANPDDRAAEKDSIAAIAADEGLTVLGWRTVPVRPEQLGRLAREAMPVIEQLFVCTGASAPGDTRENGVVLDRSAYRLRKRAEREIGAYFVSLSCRTMVYKGMVTRSEERR